METSHPLTIESFSCSWLIDQKPSLDHIFDYKQENNSQTAQNFCFSLPYTMNLVDAEEIFCNGSIIPKSVNQINVYSSPATPAAVHFPHKKQPSKYTQLIADLRLSSKKVIRMCLRFLVHRKTSRKSVCAVSSSVNVTNDEEMMSTRIEVYKTVLRRTKSWSSNSKSESRYSSSTNIKPCDYNEGSIDEAIVHCKRSYSG